MNLTQTEKLILANQYEILKSLDPAQEDHYDLLLTCLHQGFDNDFDELIPHFEPTIDEGIRQEVREILQMFRALYPEQQGGKQIPLARFAGFDGNEEGEHYSYARFLLEDRGLWRESKTDEYNSHSNMLEHYREMLRRWRQSARQFNLTDDEIAHIVEAAPFTARDVQGSGQDD